VRYVIGIDGGGTKTEAVLMDGSRRVVDRFVTGAANPHAVTYPVMEERLAEIVNRFLDRAGSDARVGGICLGLAGVSLPEEKARVSDFIRRCAERRNAETAVFVRTDAEIALMAAVGAPCGAIAVAGTGSILYGVTPDGQQFRVGGWGHLLGDEGSGYAIGLRTLQAVMQSHDGVLPDTALTGLVLKHCSLQAVADLKAYIYQPSIRKQHIAEFAALCAEAEQNGDPVARSILEEAADDLVRLALALRGKHPYLSGTPLVLSGSMFRRCPGFLRLFAERFRRRAPHSDVLLPERSAAEGAAELALLLERENRAGT
jgi:N-acetylglucosamine kinase-like BadF-type ATPase